MDGLPADPFTVLETKAIEFNERTIALVRAGFPERYALSVAYGETNRTED